MARSRSGACGSVAQRSNTRSASAQALCAREENRFSCVAHPQMRAPQGGGLSDRGQDAPARNRFKGLRGFKRGLRGKSKSPCPLLPSPGRRPARRRLVLTKLIIIASLSEGERTSGGAREGGGLSISPFALSGLSRIPLKRFFAGDFQSPCQKGLPLGCTMRLLTFYPLAHALRASGFRRYCDG